MDTTQIVIILEAVFAIIMAIKAILEKREKQQVVNFFDPDNDNMTPAKVIDKIPTKAYTMSETVKEFLLTGHDQAEQAIILQQVIDAENQRKIRYVIRYPRGYYQIDCGQIVRHGGD